MSRLVDWLVSQPDYRLSSVIEVHKSNRMALISAKVTYTVWLRLRFLDRQPDKINQFRNWRLLQSMPFELVTLKERAALRSFINRNCGFSFRTFAIGRLDYFIHWWTEDTSPNVTTARPQQRRNVLP